MPRTNAKATANQIGARDEPFLVAYGEWYLDKRQMPSWDETAMRHVGGGGCVHADSTITRRQVAATSVNLNGETSLQVSILGKAGQIARLARRN